MNERLGRGLSALIPNNDKTETISAGIGTLPIERIHPNCFQPRKKFEPAKLQELAKSILENGIIQPLIVTKSEGSDYELIAGERRLEAAKLAGLDSVPVVIRSVSKKEQLQMAIIENIQREDLDPIEEALAYQALAEDFGLTHSEIAQVMAKERTTISNSLRLLKLPEDVINLVASESLSAGHARAVLAVEPDYQSQFAQFIIKYKLTVRQAEEKAKSFVQSMLNKKETSSKTAFTRSLEQELSSLFMLKVKVTQSKDRGKITLEYKSPEELERLTKLLDKLR
ncbi:MAG: ParB/RepB/Spo0J family partition protein [Candidatus Cloacimonetes bacterium]|jgi:ParB family chromosome partitioning protein|nr:ParB/RepB/Spo0J family partition protein [Candidatus Cloacimonadota bacterium]MDD2506132.1 ParB/RepB/Spo0J family partition protein [Candidatus Cloacimonadota bacterium]MDD4559719.1 ParB/RepB/Spo0J family partition protein [Candidatus Cloacimonadota bacterium]